MRISKTAQSKLVSDTTNYLKIAGAFGVSESTARRWVRKRHPMLTTPEGLQVIQQATGLKQSQILSKQ